MLPLMNEIYDKYLRPELESHGLDPDRYRLAFDSIPAEHTMRSWPADTTGRFEVSARYGGSVDPMVLPDWLRDVLAGGAAPGGSRVSPGRLSWRYVRGGRVLHAFADESATTPLCGIEPTRGDPPRPSPWIEGRLHGSWRWGVARWSSWCGPDKPHGLCRRLAQQRGVSGA